jgi:hypothetical protein
MAAGRVAVHDNRHVTAGSLDEDNTLRGLPCGVWDEAELGSGDREHFRGSAAEWVVSEHAAQRPISIADRDRDARSVESDLQVADGSHGPPAFDCELPGEAAVGVEHLGPEPDVALLGGKRMGGAPRRWRCRGVTMYGGCPRAAARRVLGGAWLGKVVCYQQVHGGAWCVADGERGVVGAAVRAASVAVEGA